MSSNSTSSISKGTMFPPQLAAEIFNKVKGHSSLAMMTTSEPIPFNGKDIFTFSLDHEIAIVGENAAKPAGGATMTPVQIRPVKVVYQSRVSDEFMLAAEEAQLDTLRAFVDGFSAKVARGLDIMAMHGVNPFDGNASSIVGNNHFDYAIPEANKIVYGHDSSAADANIEEALGKIESPTGIIMGKTIRTAVAELTTNNARKYPDFAWGATPPSLGGMKLDSNSTVEFNSSKDRAIVGDFSAFRWGFAKEMPMEIIEYGDPDGSGTDLKKANQVLIRSEAYIGWDEASVTVDNVLVSPVSTEAQVNAAPAELYGRRELYQIAVPKGDSHRWSNCRVSFFGKMWRVIGGEKRGIESSIPLLWNAIYTVEAIDE